MRRGWGTQAVHAVEIRSKTWCASCASGGGEIKDKRGGPLDEAGVRAVVSTKKKKEREGEMEGVRYEGRGVRVESRPDAGEKGETHSAQRR